MRRRVERHGGSGADRQPAAPQDIEDADPGLARARTELAWTRSSISFAALGLAIVKFRPAAGVPILVFSLVIWSVGHLPRDDTGTASRRVLIVTIAITALALSALVLTLFSYDDQGLRP
jgi:uncharacterized membrane protein YidH (DUF202 family)